MDNYFTMSKVLAKLFVWIHDVIHANIGLVSYFSQKLTLTEALFFTFTILLVIWTTAFFTTKWKRLDKRKEKANLRGENENRGWRANRLRGETGKVQQAIRGIEKSRGIASIKSPED